MLELLYGPSPRLYPDGSSPPSASLLMYDDRLGIASWTAGSGGGYIVTQLDGLTHYRAASYTMSGFVIDQPTGDWLMLDQFYQQLYYFDHKSGTVLSASGPQVGTAGYYYVGMRCSDRLLQAFKASSELRISSAPADLSSPWVVEATIPLTGSSGACAWSKTSNPNQFYVISVGGSGALYDVAARAFVAGSEVYMPANAAAWYSPLLDVFIWHSTSQTVAVYASSPKPATLSNPVAVGAFVRGHINTVRVRLLGSNSEPCADELVDWSMTAGDGDLLTPQSTTDANGYAEARYLAPLVGGNSPTITATVRF